MTNAKTVKIFASEIEYDTDGVSVEFLRSEGAYLPPEMWLEVDLEELEENDSHVIADAISDCTGWCVNTFQFSTLAN